MTDFRVLTMKNYGTPVKPYWSIDAHYPLGRYVSQEAFWYKTRAAAIAEGTRLAREDKCPFFDDLDRELYSPEEEENWALYRAQETLRGLLVKCPSPERRARMTEIGAEIEAIKERTSGS